MGEAKRRRDAAARGVATGVLPVKRWNVQERQSERTYDFIEDVLLDSRVAGVGGWPRLVPDATWVAGQVKQFSCIGNPAESRIEDANEYFTKLLLKLHQDFAGHAAMLGDRAAYHKKPSDNDKMLLDPRIAAGVGGWKPMSSNEDWVETQIQLRHEKGSQQYFTELLAVLHEVFDDYAELYRLQDHPEPPQSESRRVPPGTLANLLVINLRKEKRVEDDNLARQISNAEKFYVDPPAREALHELACSDEAEAVLDRLRWPYRSCWLEVESTTTEDGGLVVEGYLVECDDSLQVGTITHSLFHENDKYRGIGFPVPTTHFDLKDGVAFTPGIIFGDRNRPRPPTVEDIARWDEFTDNYYAPLVIGFLTALNRGRVVLPRGDGSGSEPSGSPGNQKIRRQDFHLVKVNIDNTRLDSSGSGGGGTGVSKGEHTVRAHPRYLRSGRIVEVKAHSRGHGPLKSPRAGYRLV